MKDYLEPGRNLPGSHDRAGRRRRAQKTPNEIAFNILLAGLTIIFLLAVVTLQPFAIYSGAPQTVFVLVSLLVCLIPTTIGGLLSAIGIAGMDRLVQHNVLAMSGRAVEAAGDVNTLLLDKTGTITLGNRQASKFIPAPGVSGAEWPMRRSCPRWRTRRRKVDRLWCWPKKVWIARPGTLPTTRIRAIHSANAHVRREHERHRDPQRCGRCHNNICHEQRLAIAGEVQASRGSDRAFRRNSAGSGGERRERSA